MKSLLYSLNTVWGVTSERCPSRQHAPGLTIQLCSGGESCQREGNVIDSGFEPIPSAREANISTYTVKTYISLKIEDLKLRDNEIAWALTRCNINV